MKELELKQNHNYNQDSFLMNFEVEKGRRLKIYNKTLHPLFATDSASKRMGMGGRQFFLSSNYSYSKFHDSVNTGRLRIEESFYFKSKEEEQKWFDMEDDGLIEKILKHLRAKGSDFIKEIPFEAVWNAFWYHEKPHIFVEESHKAAVIYAYNEETC